MQTRYALVFLFLALAVTVTNIAYIGWHVMQTDVTQEPLSAFSYRGHDYPEVLPLPFGHLPPILISMKERVLDIPLGLDHDDEWASLTSTSYGYVRLGPDDRMFMVTMFHELHCLRVLNLAFGKHKIATIAHIQHCLNYLRLGSLCSSDLTLEPGNFEDQDFGTENINGATYECRDWRAVYPVMDDNYYAWVNKTSGSDELGI